MAENLNIKSILSPGLSNMGGSLVNKTRGDRVIWAIVIILTLASLLLVYSSTGSLAYRMSKSNESYLFKQFAFIIFGLFIIYWAHRINYTIYSRVAIILFLASVPLLIYTLAAGVELNAGSRWIKLPVINMTMQTSDLAKLALFMYLGRQLSRKQKVIKDFKKGFLPILSPVILICSLIAPANLSTAILIAGTSFILMFIGRVNTKHILATLGIAFIPIVLLVGIAISTYDKETHETKKLPGILTMGRIPTWISRVQTFYYGSNELESDKTYQVNQAKIAIAKGGILGVGPGNSEQRNFLPHSYSDFIYAIIIEEYGLFGAAFIVFIYLLFLYRCIRIYKRCPYAFGAFLALGLSFMLAIQAMANMAVNVGLFPNTGVTLPLVSMGGSSFLFTCLSIGIILSVSRNVEQQEGTQVEEIKKEIEEEEVKEIE
ncbi:MAG TPA: FtsW/RodA/SpoVE family cell cycle protein [Ferruginibacter sp.]|jgi:cell division protein FtsW|nr:FtsW/RodA/SpoVE family cell cycle protein [Ferruginibacter sp.]MBP6371744.1 FtsW/RodA/SpoVE family cell cycle protein [Ferruginibacter sp.]MBP6988738.1 FtsW/RodA/SpoVE family cell cycle protein [Ferruginibacter sp.]MBP7718586.1 FtsW/RodA/SpoVE family cell cycle protein [Ferruginibacter sp.]MBP8611795.1 FtsW/RodA/SpoVE family cell cycle protein [Ferruginibacter sp.]